MTIAPELENILKQYHPNPRDAVWNCHGTWVAYHKALELIARKARIQFDPPEIIVADSANKMAVIRVTGTMMVSDTERRTEWSIGEAAPYNNKNTYPWAMAEKRARDRVILKLLGLAGEVYSEEEAEDFKPRDEPRNDAPPQNGAASNGNGGAVEPQAIPVTSDEVGPEWKAWADRYEKSIDYAPTLNWLNEQVNKNSVPFRNFTKANGERAKLIEQIVDNKRGQFASAPEGKAA